MIKMQQPSFCFNSCDVGDPHYKMWKTIVGRVGMTPTELAGEIAAANKAALASFGEPLVNVIINSHGSYGDINIAGLYRTSGVYPMDKDKLGAFGILKPLGIETIWLVSCKAARGEYGQDFCRELAKVAGTEVIASEDSQIVTKWQGIELFLAKEGHIDDFEGTVYSFTSDGHMTKGIDPQKNYRFYASGGSAWDD